MTEPLHGTRARYQTLKCRCVSCRSANAAYESEYRRIKRQGKVPMGAVVSAIETWRQLRVLKKEHGNQKDVAERLGYGAKQLQFDRRRITRRNALKVRRLYQQDILDGLSPTADAPDVTGL